MRISAISGYGTKGPACFLVETGGRRFILDIGAGPDLNVKPDISSIGPVDAVLLSHAHPDHVGALDLLPQLGNPPIYATSLVHSFTQTNQFGQPRILPIAGQSEIGGIDILTGRAGHAPGGIWIRIGGESGLLYTGDFCHEGLLFKPDPMPRARLVIADASYGTYDEPLALAHARLAATASELPVLFPVPAGGRGLEMAMAFDALGHGVGLCPAHFEVAAAILASNDGLPEYEAQALDALMGRMARLEDFTAPRGVMIAAKPNANGGLAGRLVSDWSDRQDWNLVFTGHLAEGTPSKTLVDAGHARFIRWNVHPRLSDLVALIKHSQAEAVMPAFLAAAHLPDVARQLPVPIMSPDHDVTNLQSEVQTVVIGVQ